MYDMIRATAQATHSQDLVRWLGKYIDAQIDTMSKLLKRPSTDWESTQSLRHTIDAFERLKGVFCDPEWVMPQRPKLARPPEFTS